MDIFAAGSSISATTVEWAVVELLKNQVVLKIAQPETREAFHDKGNVAERGLSVNCNTFSQVDKSSLRCGQLAEIQSNGLKLRSFIPRDLWIQRLITWGMTHFLLFGARRRICPGMLFGLADIERPLAQLL
ncbi:tabersonine 16-hydroxylase 2-like [Capsicum annuum]